mgnify:CR=1 FL=1
MKFFKVLDTKEAKKIVKDNIEQAALKVTSRKTSEFVTRRNYRNFNAVENVDAPYPEPRKSPRRNGRYYAAPVHHD